MCLHLNKTKNSRLTKRSRSSWRSIPLLYTCNPCGPLYYEETEVKNEAKENTSTCFLMIFKPIIIFTWCTIHGALHPTIKWWTIPAKKLITEIFQHQLHSTQQRLKIPYADYPSKSNSTPLSSACHWGTRLCAGLKQHSCHPLTRTDSRGGLLERHADCGCLSS